MIGDSKESRTRRSIGIKKEEEPSLSRERNYNLTSSNPQPPKLVPNKELKGQNFCERSGISPQHLQEGGNSETERGRLTSGRLRAKKLPTHGAEESDNFLREPEDDYYRGRKGFQCPNGHEGTKEPMNKGPLSVMEGDRLQPGVLNGERRRKSKNIPEVLEYYHPSYRREGLKTKIRGLLKRVDLRFQLKLMRYMKGRNYSVESEFLELRGGGRILAYYYREYGVLLPLIVATVELLISLLGLLVPGLYSVSIAACIIIGGLFLSILYYYIRTYCKIKKMGRCFKKHGVIIDA
ncbi:hypothetical protein C922_05828 [Plasmodium inui San Antonio 1]|uniref:Uncharacterized protein n=1 Tax=Plasmodium inui San Antonio 1 TaxID=1237626 RepID=W7AEV0_9APIC|nr:hypothetical protein C922_05828 [Plasmodium inui San Antonio 1]EUD63791.1 hypothetical protein C922_05828 [Plasmodium inui San Antonio 1]